MCELIVRRLSLGAAHNRRPKHVMNGVIAGQRCAAIVNILKEFLYEPFGRIRTRVLNVLYPRGKMCHDLANVRLLCYMVDPDDVYLALSRRGIHVEVDEVAPLDVAKIIANQTLAWVLHASSNIGAVHGKRCVRTPMPDSPVPA